MKSVLNKSRKALRVPLGGGKSLFLGPGKTGQIADRAAELPALKKLVKAGDLEIYDEASGPAVSAARGGGGHEATHGHVPTTMIRPKGDR